MTNRFLGDAFVGLSCPFRVLFCSGELSCRTHLELLDRAVSVAQFLTGGMFECDIAHRRSMAVQCMLYKIRCKPIHPLNGAPPGLYVPVRVYTRCASCTSVYICAASLKNLAVSQDWFFPLSVPQERSCRTRSWWCGTSGFKEQGQCFFIDLSCSILSSLLWSSTIFPFLFFWYIGWNCGAGVFGLISCISFSLSLALPTSFNNNYKNNNYFKPSPIMLWQNSPHYNV